MLRIRQSNRLDRLADDLIATLAAPTGAHPLEPEQVVVQSPGMATWLRHRLAEHAGIAAAVEFPLPAALVWSVVRLLVPEAQETSPYGKRLMAWRLMALLDPEQGALADDPRFRSLLDYLDDDGESGLKRHQLAQRVADVFDQYLVYRPDWMMRWRQGAGDDDPAARAEPWQPELWRRLVAASDDAPDRAALQARACRRLEEDPEVGELLRRHLPPRLMVFGISAMPPEQLRALLGLARHIEVRVLVFNPCSQFWSDIVSERYLARLVADETARDETAPTHPYYDTGHPLLASLGTAGRDFIDLLLELGPEAEPEDAFEPPAGDSMLATLQRDILELDADAGPLPLAADDVSIRFSDCHGPLRELEALHDWLLARFEADPELRPRDIVVMIPDIDRYAPCVEAVFGQSGDPALQIPYAISDRGQRGESPILGAVAALLRLPRSRLPVSELLGILETPAVLRAFGLDETDLEQIAWWLAETGVRWGRDGDHWRQLGFEPPDPGEGPVANTWAFGTERMLLGYAMGGDTGAASGAGLFRDTLPLAGVDGAGAEAVGALLSFLDRVDEFRVRLAGPHPAREWARLLRELLDAFLDPDDDEALALGGIHQLIAEFGELEDSAGLTEALSLDVIEAALEPVLQAPGGGHRFLAGQLTFCTLMPMRTIPFRVVALLGMNDGDYPRREVPLGFDLLAQLPRKGDRARRLEDRYLFLEAILAARDHLYVSWSGRSPTDDSVQPPSVVVSELREALARRFRVPESGDEAEAGRDLAPGERAAGGRDPATSAAAVQSGVRAAIADVQ
ncbi:MAG: exodeoxyribonuclease V subunit gamma [Gammaproteobacteria bacterium]|nr:exodeoxyribonuclease V subunit gamma [Gammaproteobacteria bacterium]